MSSFSDERLARLEQEVQAISNRLDRIETAIRLTAPTPAEPVSAPPRTAPAHDSLRPRTTADERPRVTTPSPPPGRDLEEFLGGRLLAVVGGIAIVLGLAFLVALAIDRGWLDERMRVLLAFAGSTTLVVVGAWLHERRGRTQASLAAVGTGVAGLFLALTAATALYALVPVEAGLGLALAIGAVGAGLAVVWSSPVLAGLGTLGAVAAPVLVDAVGTGEALVYLGVAYAASTAVLAFRGWSWLRASAFAIAMPQVAAWAFDESSIALALAVLALFGLLTLAGVLLLELREAPTLRASTVAIVSINALTVGALGHDVVSRQHELSVTGLWIGALALVHLALGVGVLLWRERGDMLALFLLGVALAAGDVAFALLVEGVLQALVWAISAPLLGVIARRYAAGPLAAVAVAGQLALAILHTVAYAAPPDALVYGAPDLGAAALSLVAIAAAAVSASLLGLARGGREATLAHGVAAVAILYLASVGIVTAFQPGPDALDTGVGLDVRQQGQALLSAFWALCGFVALALGLARGWRDLRLAAFALLALAVAKVFLYDMAALEAGWRVLSFVALGLLLLVAAFAYQRMTRTTGRDLGPRAC